MPTVADKQGIQLVQIKPLNTAEQEDAAEELLRHYGEKSFRSMAADIECSESHIRRVRDEFFREVPEGDAEAVALAVQTGTTRPKGYQLPDGVDPAVKLRGTDVSELGGATDGGAHPAFADGFEQGWTAAVNWLQHRDDEAADSEESEDVPLPAADVTAD